MGDTKRFEEVSERVRNMMLAPNMHRYVTAVVKELESLVRSARLLTDAWDAASSRPGVMIHQGFPVGLAEKDLYSLQLLHAQLAEDLQRLDKAANAATTDTSP